MARSEGGKSLDAMLEIRCAEIVCAAGGNTSRMRWDALLCCVRWILTDCCNKGFGDDLVQASKLLKIAEAALSAGDHSICGASLL